MSILLVTNSSNGTFNSKLTVYSDYSYFKSNHKDGNGRPRNRPDERGQLVLAPFNGVVRDTTIYRDLSHPFDIGLTISKPTAEELEALQIEVGDSFNLKDAFSITKVSGVVDTPKFAEPHPWFPSSSPFYRAGKYSFYTIQVRGQDCTGWFDD